MQAYQRWVQTTALIAVAISAKSVAAGAQTWPGPTYFHMYSGVSGQCVQPIEYDANPSMNNLPTVQQPCVGYPPFQQIWTTYRTGSSSIPGLGDHIATFQLMNLLTGKCLDLRDGNTADGAYVQQYTCNNSNTQLWAPKFTSQPGYVRLVNVRSGKCLDVAQGSSVPGTLVWSFRCVDFDGETNWAQLWYFY